ncbi:MAG: cobalamin B12-binding domain-containing protein [Bacillota bacterium]
MKALREKLEQAMVENKKDTSVSLVSEALEEGLSPIDFYLDIITPIMHAIDCDSNDYDCIWHEHQMTSIARTLIEMTYPYILKEKTHTHNKHALIVCPREEYHELGAIIGTHMLGYYGFKTTYVGANTPFETVLSALKNLRVEYLVISVSNSFHLFEVNKLIKEVRKTYPGLKIIGAGRGFEVNESTIKDLVDTIITDDTSIRTLLKKEGLE